jgi:hypothetical protein
LNLKKFLKVLDRVALLGMVSGVRFCIKKWQLKSCLRSSYHTSFTVHSKNMGYLADLCDFYGSDKGSNSSFGRPYVWDPHRYTDFYEMVFQNKQNTVRRVFECGIGTSNVRIPANMGVGGRPGASLRAWRDYFPNADVYGADIDVRVLFEEERIQTFYFDQLDFISIESATQNFQSESFDFMVDDGLHTFEAALTLFLAINRLLSPDGIYVIEDVTPKTMRQLLRVGVIPDSFDVYPITFEEVGKNQELNSLLMITRANVRPRPLIKE